MPDFKDYTRRQLKPALDRIGQGIYEVVAPLGIRAWWSREPLPFGQRTEGKELDLSVGDKWGELFDCAWFHFTGEVPASATGQHVVLLLDVNGEMCVFDQAGVPVRGLTNVSSTFSRDLGLPGKRVLQVSPCAQGGEAIDVWADAGCNDLFGRLQENGRIKEASIAVCHDEVRALYYDYEVLLDLLGVLPQDSPRYQQILAALNDAAALLYEGLPAAAGRARIVLAPLLAQQGGDPSLRISAVGHAHMDLAWLWPIRETIRKGARTFSTVIELMDRYPDYVFGASQPQYLLWMKEHYPRLYRKIAEKVREGRLEPQGAMWVEADTNVSGGEALVRQMLLGKRWWKSEFGVDVRYLWLPDVFGYSAALPQLLKGAGVDYFSTQKLSWSLINDFPHQSFHWQGVDGSQVLTHMLPEENYNSPAAPRSVRRIETNYKDVGVSEHALMVYGIGDGGGGPGAEHLERLSRIKNLAGLSPVTQEPVAAFLERWSKQAEGFPTWVGELYLERHQGTLTTNARNKRYNRKLELGLRELEWTALLAGLRCGAPYPTDRLRTIWREVLLYQFHDILPGSSIKRVYDESVARYEALLAEVESTIAEYEGSLAASLDTGGMSAPVLVRNSLSWERSEWVRAGEEWLYVAVPAMGYTLVDADTGGVDEGRRTKDELPAVEQSLTASETRLENELLRVCFAADGTIVSLYDKRARREVLPEGQAANQLLVYRDLGDAWDFPMDYAEQAPRALELVSTEARVDGPRASLTHVYRLGHSELRQEVVLTAGSPRLDFHNQLRWRETQSMLRARFPVAVHAEAATYEIQFGHIRRPTHRNTTWDLARDEVAAQKWVDVSQTDYGLALLNDCKYGHKVKADAPSAHPVLDLNLLRSVPYPGPRLVQDTDVAPGEPHHAYTDQCDHRFRYSLYPHSGDHVEGKVVRAGYELNVPLRVVSLTPGPGQGLGDREASLLRVDAPNVVIEAVKRAEDREPGESAWIVRLYECHGAGAQTTLCPGFPISEAAETNLMEEVQSPLRVQENCIQLQFRPFEVKTVRLTPAAREQEPRFSGTCQSLYTQSNSGGAP